MNKRAQLFTLDLLLALVPLTIALGMSANALSGVAAQIQDYADAYSDRRIANDAMDALIKTSGVPSDWETNVSNIKVIGIAAWDSDNNKPISNYIDAWKYFSLDDTNVTPKLEELFKTTKYNLSLYLYNVSEYNISNLSLPSMGSNVPSNASKVIAVERIMLIDNLLQIKGESPEGLQEISNEGGGRYKTCSTSELSLTQTEINNKQFWFYMNFTCSRSNPCPSSMVISVNDNWGGCSDDCDGDHDRIVKPSDVPISQNFNLSAWTTIDQRDCDNVDTSVEYWVENSTSISYVMWVKVPATFLVVGQQQIYLDVRGVESFSSGWIATAPTWINRDQLEQYFRSTIPLDDVPCKLLLKVWE